MLSILVIEDNEDALELVQALLEMKGHSVQGVNNGKLGLELALSMKPDIALVDIALPGLDGFEVAKALREAQSDRQLILVAVTGYGRPEDRARALDSGFDVFLVTPSTPSRSIVCSIRAASQSCCAIQISAALARRPRPTPSRWTKLRPRKLKAETAG